MSDAVDDFDGHPKRHEPSGGWPTVQHRPDETPDAKHDQHDIDDDETEAMILADKTSNERRGREDDPKTPNVFFN